jgi:ATP-dependent DNA helicase RecG
MTPDELQCLVKNLCSLDQETECVEFKCNNENHEEIGEYISALSNSAALHSKEKGFIVWGIDDTTHSVVGTKFLPKKKKIGGPGKNSNQELESWLLNHLEPRIEVRFHEGLVDGLHVVVFEIQPAFSHPVRFKNNAFIRVGTYKKKLNEYPEKERLLWELLKTTAFEEGTAKDALSDEQVLQDLDYTSYFKLTELPTPDNRQSIIYRLLEAKIIKEQMSGRYAITNMGAILFANDLEKFGSLGRKALRIVLYQGANRVNTIKERLFKKGYGAAFTEIIEYINDLLPSSEVIGKALREEKKVYPEVAIRELVANALIHQDFTITGNGPMVELFDNRIEITNPGIPLIDTLRFIDGTPRSRNDYLARLMRRLKICEERGSGIDKVIFYVELFQLPPPDFRATTDSMVAVLYKYKELATMGKEEKIRACYQHACLQWVSGSQMSNSSLRKRFGIKKSNYPMASRIIKDTIKAELIKPYGDVGSKKTAKYIPFWA